MFRWIAKKSSSAWLVVSLFALVAVTFLLPGQAHAAELNYLVGRGIADITGPPVGAQMWGFVRQDQITEGIHLRLRARAFVIAEPKGGKRIALVCADLGSATYELQREVVERLRKKFGETYSTANVIISATHTHSGPGGYWQYGSDTPLGGGYYAEHFELLAAGITAAITAAHEDLKPAGILINRGQLHDAGAQRSLPAYMNNPESERARYDSNTDTDMTLLRFSDGSNDLGVINWFAVHPTAMTFNNKLISGDHKGYAELRFERHKGATYRQPGEFVAAFAQSNCGDVTANLNLNNTGPGDDEFETTQIIGERQFQKALELFEAAAEPLSGPIDYRQSFVDFSKLTVRDEFTQAGEQHTWPSAYGYAFAAGSTEDGGGHPLFREGMKDRVAGIDTLAKQLFKDAIPSDALRKNQSPKAILFAPGEMQPQPGQSQIQPLTLVRIGQLVLIVGPAEFTTMSGRRIRNTVGEILGDAAKYLVTAGYSNSYAGYVTTNEEYQTQQYEGGHTLFGPWTLAAYQQEYARLATALHDGSTVEPGAEPLDVRGQVKPKTLGPDFDVVPNGSKFGDAVSELKEKYSRGEVVEATFWTGHPRMDFHTGDTFLAVERQMGSEWQTVATDSDWETKCRWKRIDAPGKPLQFIAVWNIPESAEPGKYRIVHYGSAVTEKGATPERIEGVSSEFTLE